LLVESGTYVYADDRAGSFCSPPRPCRELEEALARALVQQSIVNELADRTVELEGHLRELCALVRVLLRANVHVVSDASGSFLALDSVQGTPKAPQGGRPRTTGSPRRPPASPARVALAGTVQPRTARRWTPHQNT
jgi:hypothetical protein